MKSILKTLAILFVMTAGLVATACNASQKVHDGAVYAEHPKANILETARFSTYSARLICTEKSQVHLMFMYDNSFAGIEEVKVGKDVEVNKALVMCGNELEELRRLADIGREHEKK